MPLWTPMECYFSDIPDNTLIVVIHVSCHIAPHKPLTLEQAQNLISSGLLHTIRQTSNTPTLNSTSDGWFHFTAGPLTRSLILFLVLGLLALNPTHKLEQWGLPVQSWERRGFEAWVLSWISYPFAKLLRYEKTRGRDADYTPKWRGLGWLTNGDRAEKLEIVELERTKRGVRPVDSSNSKLVNMWPTARTIPSVQAPASVLSAQSGPNRARIPPIPLSSFAQLQPLFTNLSSCANHPNYIKPLSFPTHLYTLFWTSFWTCLSFFLASQRERYSSFCPRQISLCRLSTYLLLSPELPKWIYKCSSLLHLQTLLFL